MKASLGVGLAVLLVMLVGACSGDATTTGDSDIELLGQWLPWGDPEQGDRLEREYFAREQDLIASCMQDAGLEYVPVALESISFGPGTGISRPDHARRFGFGISTNDEQFAAAAQNTASVSDPNWEYQESLSTERRIAYSEQKVACDEQVRQIAPQASEQFKRAVDDLVDLVRADPAVIEAETEWAGCVRAGNESLPQFASLDELYRWIYQEFERVKERPDELVRLQDLERELAVRNLECEPPLLAVMAEAATQYESGFVADHSDVFEARRDYLDS